MGGRAETCEEHGNETCHHKVKYNVKPLNYNHMCRTITNKKPAKAIANYGPNISMGATDTPCYNITEKLRLSEELPNSKKIHANNKY